MVCAQEPGDVQPAEVRRPFRGLFGAPAVPGSSQALDSTASMYGAYDDDLYAAQGGVALSEDVRQSGWFGGVEAGLNYKQSGRRGSFGVDGGVGLIEYPDQPLYAMYRAGGNLNASLTRTMSLSASETFSYAPEYHLGVFVSPMDSGQFQDPFASVSSDQGIFREHSYRTTTNVGLSQSMRDSSTLSAFYALTTANYESGELDYVNQGVGARYTRQLSRNVGLHAGYNYGRARYPKSSFIQSGRGIHNVDVGANYGRALSISRRTQFSFSTGSALYFVNQGIQQPRHLEYALLGSANLSHEMGRTWTTAIAYQRSLSFHEGFVDPFLAQSASASLTGLLSHRLHFMSTAAWTGGVIGGGTNNDFSSSSAGAGLQYALTRALASYVNYIYYQYTVPPGLAVDPRFPPSLARTGVRFGLTTSIPLIRAK